MRSPNLFACFFASLHIYTRICRCWCTMSMMQCVHVHIPQLTYHLRWTSPYIFGKVHINKEEIVVLMLCKSHATSNMLDINNFMMIWTKTIQFHCRSRKKITKYMPRVNALHQLVFLWKGPPTLRPLRSSGQVPAGYLALVSPQGIGEKKWEAFNHHQKITPEKYGNIFRRSAHTRFFTGVDSVPIKKNDVCNSAFVDLGVSFLKKSRFS